MTKRTYVRNLFLFSLLLLGTVSVFVAQTRNQTASTQNDFKVKYKMTVGGAGMAGQPMESVTMIKGARERSENHTGYGYDTVTITQCDLKQTVQFSDATKKYIITPMDTGEPPARTAPGGPAPAPTAPRKGGLVEYVTSTIDTGERKEMFGFAARHIKSSTTIKAGPDSCNPGNRRTEVDGWYIDLNVEFNCDINRPTQMTPAGPRGVACKDEVRTRREGNAKLGYPLIETMKMYGDNGQVVVSQTKEVIELSRATLDKSLFDVPAGYTQVANSSELYGTPSMNSIMAAMGQGQNPGDTSRPSAPSTSTSASQGKQPGSVLVGVVQFNNKSRSQISADALRQRLIGSISAAGVDAIPLNASSQMEAEAEAKVKKCDFILYTDIATLKTNKLGGLLGGISGMGSGAAKTEAKLEFKLFAVGESTPRLQSNASAKEEGEENSAGVAVDAEARAVVAKVKQR